MASPDTRYGRAWPVLSLSFLLVGCGFQITPPLIKIGLVAPFEGAYRSIGYDVLGGVKLALAEVNEAGGVSGYKVELLALNDNADPEEAKSQAYELTLDPQIIGVIGHFREDTTPAAAPIYAQAGLVLLPTTSADEFAPPQPAFVAKYQEINGGEPGPLAGTAYDATKILLQAVAQAIATDGQPTREGVMRALQESERLPGIILAIDFDERGQEINIAVLVPGLEKVFPG